MLGLEITFPLLLLLELELDDLLVGISLDLLVVLFDVGAAAGHQLLEALNQLLVDGRFLCQRLLVLLVELSDLVLVVEKLLVKALVRLLGLLFHLLELISCSTDSFNLLLLVSQLSVEDLEA